MPKLARRYEPVVQATDAHVVRSSSRQSPAYESGHFLKPCVIFPPYRLREIPHRARHTFRTGTMRDSDPYWSPSATKVAAENSGDILCRGQPVDILAATP